MTKIGISLFVSAILVSALLRMCMQAPSVTLLKNDPDAQLLANPADAAVAVSDFADVAKAAMSAVEPEVKHVIPLLYCAQRVGTMVTMTNGDTHVFFDTGIRHMSLAQFKLSQASWPDETYPLDLPIECDGTPTSVY